MEKFLIVLARYRFRDWPTGLTCLFAPQLSFCNSMSYSVTYKLLNVLSKITQYTE